MYPHYPGIVSLKFTQMKLNQHMKEVFCATMFIAAHFTIAVIMESSQVSSR